MKLTLVDLRTENRIRPLGLGEFTPRFSWKVEDAEPNYLQRTRRIQVSATPDFEKPLWDSRVVRSAESHLVAYRGPALEPRTRYWFRVRVAGKRNQSSAWSPPEWFETALAPESWPAPFVSPQTEKDEKPDRAKVFKREFDLPFVPVAGRVYAAAPGLYEMTLNSRGVSDTVLTGCTEEGASLSYQTFDVTGLLTQGRNTLAALVGSHGARPVFSAFLDVKGTDGQVLTLSTDETWVSANAALVSSDPNVGEVYDARREGKGRWTPVTVLKSRETPPVVQTAPPVKRQECLKPQKVVTPGGGVVLDFGTSLTGWVRFSVSGKAGDKVVLVHAGVLDAKGNFPPKGKAGNRFEYILKGGGPETFEPRFLAQRFRYVKVEKWPEEVDPDAFEALALYPDGEARPAFECSQEALNELHRNLESARKSRTLNQGWTGEGSAVIVPWERWRTTGDLKALEESWSSMKAWGESILSAVPGATPDGFQTEALNTYSMGLLARSARVLGKEREAKFYRVVYRRMVEAFRYEFVTPAGRLAVPTQSAHVLALAFHLILPEHRERTLAALVALMEEGQGAYDTATLGNSIFCDVLTQGGRTDLAYGLLDSGAGNWMYRTVGGIELDPEVSGYQRIVFHPQPGGGLTWARSSLETPYGSASLAWSLAEETWTFEMKVPPNTTAVLIHRTGKTELGSGTWTSSHKMDSPSPDLHADTLD